MSTVTYDTFFPEVIPSVFGCPEIVAFNAVRNTVIDFCTETWFWQHKTFPVPGQANVAEYEPDIPLYTKLVGVVDAWYDGKNIHPKSEPELRNIFWRQDPFVVQGAPNFFYSHDTNQIRLIPIPQVDSEFEGLEMLIAVTPLRNSTSCLDTVYERYAETIAKGALARLKGQTGQPWSDTQGGMMLQKLYQYERSVAKAWVQRNKTRANMKIQFNRSEY